MQSINRLSASDKDYLDSKQKLIAELGYIKGDEVNNISSYLQKLYRQTSDTSLFQNEIIKSLARLKTKTATAMLKDLLLENPPIFENSNDYISLFNNLQDSLQLSATLFPGLLQLTMIDDYKEKIINLLVSLVDSGYVQAKDYKQHFNSIYLDAKVYLKKQLVKEQQQIKSVEKNAEDDAEPALKNYGSNNFRGSLNDYAILLVPFFQKETVVKPFFEKLLQSKDEIVRLNTAILMLRNNLPVNEKVLYQLAANESTRAMLFSQLKNIDGLDNFPTQFKTQDSITRSLLIAANEYDKMDSLVFLKKSPTTVKGKTGLVYLYKYRVKKTDDWKIALSGLQPLNEKEVDTNDDLVLLSDKKIKASESLNEQLNEQLNRMLFSFRKSAKRFYTGENNYSALRSLDDYED